MPRRRKFDVFTMSFLDTICCAFGAIVLIYMIINAAGARSFQRDTHDLRAEVDLLEEEVLEGYKELVVLRNSLDETEKQTPASDAAARIVEEMERLKEQLALADKETLSKRDEIEQLKQDLKSLEEGRRRLEGGTMAEGRSGDRVKAFEGTGDRKYLIGLSVKGDRILVLVDVSASMLDETVVNVIRLRNMPESRRRSAEKWRRAIATVDWITAQLPSKSKFQIYGFNTQAKPLVPGSAGKWLDASDASALNGSITELRKLVPQDGTSLENAFAVINELSPRPDSLILVTDGLPTQGASPPTIRKTVDGDQRLKLFEKALGRLPAGIPVNVILLPMEGDPMAPTAYWALTRRTNGIFLSPARDWP
jgi:von Willebrand factor type A domain